MTFLSKNPVSLRVPRNIRMSIFPGIPLSATFEDPAYFFHFFLFIQKKFTIMRHLAYIELFIDAL